MIVMQDVSKRWEERDIVKNISLTITKGECVALLGENGAGKSTLLKLIANLVSPTKGSIYVDGQLVADAEAKFRSKIGFVFHQHSFYSHLTAVENLKIVCKWYGLKEGSLKIVEVLRKVGLHYAKDDKIQNYSRGMLQRLAIARALLQESPLLLLDEPHTGLDQIGIEWLNTVIKEALEKGVTIVIVSHDIGQVQKLASRVIWLKRGELLKDVRRSEVTEYEFQRLIGSWKNDEN